MADKRRPPVFLERRSYRRRRMMDAVRLMPMLGAVLWMVPLLWPTGQATTTEPSNMSGAVLYVFGVWLLLIVLSAYLSRFVSETDANTTTDKDAG